MKIPKSILAIITLGLIACTPGRKFLLQNKNEPSRLHYPNQWMYHYSMNYRGGYGFFLFPDSSQAVFIPKSKKYPVMMYYRIDNDFIYIP